MAKRTLTPRQQELQQALAELKAAQAASAITRERVATARRKVALLSRCDDCGRSMTIATGREPQLCWSCWAAEKEVDRVGRLARLGYGADGKRLPKTA